MVQGMAVEALLDPGSSATTIPYSVFKKIGKKARILSDALQPLDVTLQDYNQGPIPVGAQVELAFTWKDRAATARAYIHSELTGVNESCLLGTKVIVLLGLLFPSWELRPEGEPSQSSQTQLVKHKCS